MRAACDPAVTLHEDVSLLLRWLRHDVLGVAGPCYAERRELYDFVVAELRARVPLCSHQLKPICRTMEKGRDDFLAFAKQLDADLDRLAIEFQCSAGLLRRVLQMLCRPDRDRRRWTEETALRPELRGRFWEVCQAIDELAKRRFEPVRWWRISTAGSGATFSCVATWGLITSACCNSSSTIGGWSGASVLSEWDDRRLSF